LGLFDASWRDALKVFAGVGAAGPRAAAEGGAPPAPLYLALSRDRLLVLTPHAEGRLGVGVCAENFHLTELGKASYSKKVPGRVTVYLRRCEPPDAEGGGEAPAVTLVPRVFVLDGGAEKANDFILALQEHVAALTP
jgi:hypothetical protein